jgi:hypothetical protein
MTLGNRKTGYSCYRLQTLLNLILIFSILFTIASCSASKKTAAAEPVSRNASDTVEYFDSMSFDRNLSMSLKSDLPEVTVTFPLDVNIYRIPDRIDKWFYMIGKYEGTVKPEAEGEGTRDLFSGSLSLAVKAYDMIKEKIIYSPAEKYDAKIYYKKDSGTVTKVIFTRRPPETEADK